MSQGWLWNKERPTAAGSYVMRDRGWQYGESRVSSEESIAVIIAEVVMLGVSERVEKYDAKSQGLGD